MHLFNLNEQSVFHFLNKSLSAKEIPLCFALDYSQAIGDRGNILREYISSGSFGDVKEQRFCTLFRNSTPIVDFCASIAASGTLMFSTTFSTPYENMQYHFTHTEEFKIKAPELHMYTNDDTMILDMVNRLDELMKVLQCKPKDITIIAFDSKWLSQEGIQLLESSTGKKYDLLNHDTCLAAEHYILASPNAINGLEFQAIIMLGVDEGRIPQTAGTGDVSRHFLVYSAYNMLYLSVSRAKYRIVVLEPGDNRHFGPGEKSQFRPDENHQSNLRWCSQPPAGL